MFSHRFNHLRRRAAALATATGVLGAIGALSTTPAQATPLSTSTFSYADMPDLDQQRSTGNDAAGNYHAGLPNSGLMYCGPAAAMDALAFLSDHGLSAMAPGSSNWTLNSNYERMTSRLSELGGLMSTDPNNGTLQSNFESGLQTWNTRYGAPNSRSFGIVSLFPGPDNDWRPPSYGVAALAEGFGNPVIVRIGYYNRSTINVGGQSVRVLKRTGGHYVAMTGSDASGLNFMDPADAPASTSQSTYRNRTASVSPTSDVFAWGNNTLQQPAQNVDGLTVYPTETYLKLSGWGSGNAYVEGFTVLQPSYRLTAERNVLITVREAVTRRYALAGSSVRDVAVSPIGEAAYYAAAGSSKVYRLDLASGVSTVLADTGTPVRSLAVNGVGDTVYAAADRGVSALASTGGVKAKTTLATPVDAVAYDPIRGEVDAVSADTGRVTVLGSTTLTPRGSVNLAGSALKGAAKLTASVDPAGGSLQVQRADSGTVVSMSVSSLLTRLGSVRAPSKTVGVSRIAVGSHQELEASGRLVSISGLQEIVRDSYDIRTVGQQADQLAG